MSKFSSIIIAMIALSMITGNAGAVPVEEWNRTFRGAGNASAHSVLQTADGGYILAGATCSNLWQCNPWLVKTDAWGNEQWNRTFRDLHGANSVQQTADGGYILATGRSLIKTDASGSEQWNRTFNKSGTFESFQQTSDGGYIGSGAINRESFFDYHPDGWLIKTDENGDEQWNRTFWGGGFGVIESVQQTGDGGYVLAGSRSTIGGDTGGAWLIKVNANGDEQWNRTFGEWNRTFRGRGEMAYSVQQTGDGGYILAGFGFLLIKTDANGSMQWGQNKKFKGKDAFLARSVQQTLDVGYIIAGESHTTGGYNQDGWLIKVDTDGNEQWNMTFGGAQEDEVYSIQQTGDGGYIVAGTTSYYGDGGSYAWLTKVSGEQTVSVKTPTTSPTQTLTAVPTITHKVSNTEKSAGFEFFLALTILLLVVIIREKMGN
ncbi:MAG: hypothetical protein E4G94_07830 [ANME-2 cluster archaeon]|nr:MAG: hypothetical protein E4G94_07830 [ANME-2 cluster archaeon]